MVHITYCFRLMTLLYRVKS